MDWIDLVQDMDQWRALVNTVMNFRIIIINPVQSDAICRYLLPSHISVS
jgi:hypothetical protein